MQFSLFLAVSKNPVLVLFFSANSSASSKGRCAGALVRRFQRLAVEGFGGVEVVLRSTELGV